MYAGVGANARPLGIRAGANATIDRRWGATAGIVAATLTIDFRESAIVVLVLIPLVLGARTLTRSERHFVLVDKPHVSVTAVALFMFPFFGGCADHVIRRQLVASVD
jgi:hypothetical protein